jgi:hypothetical protein
MKPLCIHFPLDLHYFPPRGFEYCSQHPILRRHQCLIFLLKEKILLIPEQNKK